MTSIAKDNIACIGVKWYLWIDESCRSADDLLDDKRHSRRLAVLPCRWVNYESHVPVDIRLPEGEPVLHHKRTYHGPCAERRVRILGT